MTPALAHPFLSALPLPALLLDPAERIVAANDLARKLFDAAQEGRHYITALRQPAVLDAIEETYRDGVQRQSRFFGAEGRRETTWRVTVAAVPVAGARGVLVTFEDITAVEEAGQMRRDFVANVSHELRTPLTALLGFVETLKGAARDDPQARDRFLGIMEREAGRMARLVADLLSLSRVEEEERVRPLTLVEMRALTESVVAAFEPAAAASDIDFRLTLPEAPVSIPGDANQLRQVLTNLIENAMKYGGRGRSVDIALTGPAPEQSLRGDGIRLIVTDHGEGIADHHISRLTERFYRVDSHRSREVGGTGLGLAIVKHIVNRHRGRLRIQSTLGQGSTFTVILPAA